jgi:peptidoglycan hydrolase-like protein with peptidoglycan-binding domain
VLFATLSVVTGLGWTERAPDAHAEPPEVQACIAQPVLQRGSTGSGVMCLQFTLIMQGYSVPYSGSYDQSTEDAVRWYQATHPPLVADGVAGESTLESLGIAGKAAVFVPAGALGEAPVEASTQAAAGGTPASRARCTADATLSAGKRGQSVMCLQYRLVELGFSTVSATGVYDQATQDAVRFYQRGTPPLTADGVAGPRTLAALDIWSGMTAGGGRNIGTGPFPAGMQDEAQWRLTAEGIPVYGNRTPCTKEQAITIAAEFANDGADAATQQWAVYIASREGGCRYDAVNINARTKDDSHCTFQLNALSGAFSQHGSLGRRGWTTDLVKASLQACADAASDLWVFCGRGPWTPPYSCTPPWSGSTVDQPPALLPAPPDSVVPTPADDSTGTVTPEPAEPTAPTDPGGGTASTDTTTTTVAPIDTTAPTVAP